MKNLIVCCDGTWQKLSNEYPNNVVKLTQAIAPAAADGSLQVVHYSEGVGTGDLVDKLGGGAFGWGLDDVIKNAYRFLCLNYDPDDRIYLFGFSRGAYTVRSLAGMIYNVGLLNRSHIRKTPTAYNLYRDRSEETEPDRQQAIDFRKENSQEVDITFLGCWDTVGSLGIPDQIPFFPLDNLVNQKYQFHNTQVNPKVRSARHAVAIDEERKVFYVTPMNRSDNADGQDLKQVWFPGEHGCVGGGTEAHRQLSDRALEWMLTEAEAKGLRFDRSKIEKGIEIDATIPFDNSQGLLGGLGRKIRKLSNDPQVQNRQRNSPAAELDFVYAEPGDLDVSTKERWCALPNYRPEGLEKFKQDLDDACEKNN